MGLVPRQRSSGDKRVLTGISKRGDKHLRTLLVHGARAVVRVSANKDDPFSRWVNALRDRRGMNRAIVAVANKNARIIWAVLNKRGGIPALKLRPGQGLQDDLRNVPTGKLRCVRNLAFIMAR